MQRWNYHRQDLLVVDVGAALKLQRTVVLRGARKSVFDQLNVMFLLRKRLTTRMWVANLLLRLTIELVVEVSSLNCDVCVDGGGDVMLTMKAFVLKTLSVNLQENLL